MTEAVERKIESLLRMADGMANENECANALALAQKLADAHNLDLGQIGKTGSRKDEQVSKGLYKYQRTLYTELAALNHCKVWISKGLRKGSKYQTRLLGSKMNVTTVKVMADYLEEVTNRFVRDEFEPRAYFSKEAHEYRHGMIDRLVARVKVKREAEERAREVEKREQEARARHPGAATENAIVLISDVKAAEEAANYDYEHGEGAWDRVLARRAQREEEYQLRIAQEKAWALANPDEAARKAAETQAEFDAWAKKYERQLEQNQKAADKRRQARIDKYGYDPEDYKTEKATVEDSPYYQRGNRHADDINLDDQIDEEQRKALS